VFAFRFAVLAFRFFVFAFLHHLRDPSTAGVSEGKNAVYLLFTLCLPGLIVDKPIAN